jgi:hypothetical protein
LIIIRAETDYRVKEYMKYLSENKEIAEGLAEDFDSEWECMYYVFMAMFNIPDKKALSIVDDFRSDFMLQSITEQ